MGLRDLFKKNSDLPLPDFDDAPARPSSEKKIVDLPSAKRSSSDSTTVQSKKQSVSDSAPGEFQKRSSSDSKLVSVQPKKKSASPSSVPKAPKLAKLPEFSELPVKKSSEKFSELSQKVDELSSRIVSKDDVKTMISSQVDFSSLSDRIEQVENILSLQKDSGFSDVDSLKSSQAELSDSVSELRSMLLSVSDRLDQLDEVVSLHVNQENSVSDLIMQGFVALGRGNVAAAAALYEQAKREYEKVSSSVSEDQVSEMHASLMELYTQVNMQIVE